VSKTPLSGVDTAWLRMEHPTNLMMITGVMIFRAPIDPERLKATLEQRLLRFRRFQQRVQPMRLPIGRYVWADDPRFDLDNHLRTVRLPSPGDQQALQELVSHLMSTPLDFSRPLWAIDLVEKYDTGCALIARLHHCIGDGIALVRVLLSLADTDPDAPWPDVSLDQLIHAHHTSLDTSHRSRPGLNNLARWGKVLVREGSEARHDPTRALEWARIGTRSAEALARLVLRWPDPQTLFKGKLGLEKRAAWSRPLALEGVKSVGRGAGGTVNDVLLTAITGALRRYLEGREEPVDSVNVRAVVPVNLRSLEEELRLGNRFGLVFLSLPVYISDPIERLAELKRRMDSIKETPEAMVAFGILNAIGLAPAPLQDLAVDIFGTKGTAVMTNVPGPKETIFLAGAPLDTIMFWVPQSGRLGMGVSIISYAAQVWLGVATDEGLVPDPQNIIDAFEAEFAALDRLTAQRTTAPEVLQTGSRTTSVAEMGAALDAALQTVSELVEEARKGPGAPPAGEPQRCQALTRAGRRCKNRPLVGSLFCRVHQQTNTARIQEHSAGTTI
jgi:diacylglycerol O-acyltransferase